MIRLHEWCKRCCCFFFCFSYYLDVWENLWNNRKDREALNNFDRSEESLTPHGCDRWSSGSLPQLPFRLVVDFPNKKGPKCVISDVQLASSWHLLKGMRWLETSYFQLALAITWLTFPHAISHFCTIFQMFHLTFFGNHRRQTHHKPLLWLWVYWVQLCVASCVPCHWKHRNSKRRWSTCPARPVRPAEADSLSWSTLRSIQMQRSKEAKQHVED